MPKQATKYGGVDWYHADIGCDITFRSPFFGRQVAKVVERQSGNVVKLRFQNGCERWVTTNNLTLESISK